jgi:hypothetical protein
MATIRPEITGKRRAVTVQEAKRPIGPPAGDPKDIESTPPNGDVTGQQVEEPRARGPPPILALTIPEFCSSHGISEAFYYELQKNGKGPRTMHVGRRRLISVEEAQRWREARTAKESAAGEVAGPARDPALFVPVHRQANEEPDGQQY